MNFKKAISFAVIVVITTGLFSQDRLFTYTYQSAVLNKGQHELEVNNTFRTGKTDYFARLENRTEVEIGLGNNLQTSFYLNITSITQTESSALKTEHEVSLSNEWKYKLADPVADPIGLALYGEYTVGTSEYELEGKLIADKKLGKFDLAANASYDFEAETFVPNVWGKEGKADLNVALAYELNPHFHLTFENSFQNVFAERELKHSALYSGLGISYVQEKFWVNFSVMPQITSFKGTTINSTLNLNEFEKLQCRLLFSVAI
ncbi:MAG: hypothetical protein WCK78_16405 [Paludibacter sp.]